MQRGAFARGRVGLCLLLLGGSLLGCERQAPGPEECQRFAAAVVLQTTQSPYLTPEMQQLIEDETRKCLTVPYDRELLSCVLTTNRGKLCLDGFRRRTGRAG